MGNKGGWRFKNDGMNEKCFIAMRKKKDPSTHPTPTLLCDEEEEDENQTVVGVETRKPVGNRCIRAREWERPPNQRKLLAKAALTMIQAMAHEAS